MKKLFFSLALLLGCTLSISAQKVMHGRFYAIPSYFTYNHTPYLVDRYKDGENYICNLYDLSLSEVASFKLGADIEEIEVEAGFDKNGLAIDFSDIYLT